MSLPSTADLLEIAVEAVGGHTRDGQREMAQAIEDALTAHQHLLVQAGTGTGKSLGYLVPLIRHAVKASEPVVISTATLALQSQLVKAELPRLADALQPAIGRPITYEVVKGRANYLCRYKLDGGFPDDELDLPGAPASGQGNQLGTSPLGKEIVRVRDWAEKTDTGDRDDLVPGVSERAWRQVSVTAHECLGGQKCPMATDCFVEQIRERARKVDVVVTNHALLAIDAFEGRTILPPYSALAVDEAHELADRVTGVVSDQLSPTMVSIASSRSARAAGAAASAAARLAVAADDLSDCLDQLNDGRLRGGVDEDLLAVLVNIRDAAKEALTALRPASASDVEPKQQVARAAVQEIYDVADRLVTGGDGDVVWLTVSEFNNQVRRSLWVAPLQVGGMLADQLFGLLDDEEQTVPVILTSATLTAGGGFDAVVRQTGLSLAKPQHKSLDVGSPFDYPKQAILYVAKHLPTPGRDGSSDQLTDELADLVEAAGGRTLGLFSSRRAAEQAAAALRERTDLTILCQGEDSTPTLLKQFAADPATCLFGTLTLWQGVDVPGDACQLVIIDRLPFPRPDDPLLSARAEAVGRNGGNGFMSVSAHYAAQRLAQGVGRLIRRSEDRGVVAILDPRLATARYGGFISASLPPMWRTTDKATVLAALRRLGEAQVSE